MIFFFLRFTEMKRFFIVVVGYGVHLKMIYFLGAMRDSNEW